MAAGSLGTIIKILVAGVLGGFIGLCVLLALIFLLPSGRSQTSLNDNAQLNSTKNSNKAANSIEFPSPEPSQVSINSSNNNDSGNVNSSLPSNGNLRVVSSPSPQPTKTPVVVKSPPTTATRTPVIVRSPPPTKPPVVIPTVHP